MITQRLNKLQATLKNPILIKKKENLLYLTGRCFMHGYLLVKPLRRHSDLERSEGEEFHKKSSFGLRPQDDAAVFLGDGLEKVEEIHSDFLKNVGMYVPKNQTLELFGEFTYSEVKYIKLKNPHLKLKVIVKRSPADFQRQIKDAKEIALVKKSMQIVERVFKLARKEIKKPGMTELRLAGFIQKNGLRIGAEDVSFPPIVASGANAAVPHHVPSAKPLKSGEPIIIDFGFKYKNYCSDFTRTVFLKYAPKRLADAYNQVEKAYKESIWFIDQNHRTLTPALSQRERPRKQITAGHVCQKSVDILAEKHLDKYFIHSLGHGIGLEIHELPNLSPGSKDMLKDGMIFSIEPGVYIPRVGGIRIEDLVYLDGGKVKKFINVPTDLKQNIV